MKLLALFFCFTYSAFALPNPAPRQKSFDLIKCTAPRLGTIWASFGHVMNSSDPEPRYFFTEVNVIDNADVLSRARFWGPKEAEAAGTSVLVSRGGMKLAFPGAEGSRHKVLLVNNIKNDPNSFMGNWEFVTAGGESVFDQASCTAL